MKISYVIPAHNEEARIAKCLESLSEHIKRESRDSEIVVVNTSTDRTKEIALRFPGVVVIDEKRKGVARARDTGYRASKGELIANIDADVLMIDGWSTAILKAFADDPKLVAISGPFIFYDLPKRTKAAINAFYRLGFAIYLLNRFVFDVGSMLQGGNFVVRRTALDKIGGGNTDLVFYGEEIDLARRLHKVGRVKFTFDLPLFSSGRRLAAEGIITMGIRYGINYMWTIFFKKPFTKEDVAAIRPELTKELKLKKNIFTRSKQRV